MPNRTPALSRPGIHTPLRSARHVAWVGCILASISAAQAQSRDDAQPPLRPGYYTCVDASHGVTLALNQCIAAEYAFQDKRLNLAYRRLRTLLPDAQRTALRDEEREWLKQRDEHCAPSAHRGTASLLDSNQCLLDESAARAEVLEHRSRR